MRPQRKRRSLRLAAAAAAGVVAAVVVVFLRVRSDGESAAAVARRYQKRPVADAATLARWQEQEDQRRAIEKSARQRMGLDRPTTSGRMPPAPTRTPGAASSGAADNRSFEELRSEARAAGDVFVDATVDGGRVYHEADCPAAGPRMTRMRLALARQEQFLPAWDCHQPRQ